ncbi:MAG: molecular chaperone TorD family protein [Acidobacteria bacterium]|nr:molecular chaperone TorD family protein [Acidobacteriota bacterium]
MELVNPVAQAYMFAAQAFSYPSKDFYDLLASEASQAWLRGVFSRLPFCVALNEDLRFSLPWEEVEPEYINAFDVAPACPLHEGLIVQDGTRQALFMDLMRFYDHLGVHLCEEPREYPDHLCVELELMAYLAEEETKADGTEAKLQALRLAQRDFLERHLGAWFPLVNRRLPGATRELFYTRAGACLEVLLLNHRDYLQKAVTEGTERLAILNSGGLVP